MSRRRGVELLPIIVFFVLHVLLLLSSFGVKPSAAEKYPFRVANTNCIDVCGNVSIPFPFGIGTSCFLDEWYEVVCLEEKNTSVPRLKKIDLEVLDISLPYRHYNNSYSDASDGWINVSFPITYSNRNCTSSVGAEHPSVPPSLSGSNFFFSQDLNVFTAVGCDGITFLNSTESAIVGCKSECRERNNATQLNDCSGHGCCQNTIPSNLQAFNISFQSMDAASVSGDRCSYAFLADRSWFRPGYTDVYSLRNAEYVPILLGWGIANDTSFWYSLIGGRYNEYPYICSSYSLSSLNYDRLPYQQCYCYSGYEGNAYLGGGGCQDIDECQDPSLYTCSGTCVNTKGSYKCEDGSRAVKLAMMVIGGFIGGLLLFLLSVSWLCKRRRNMKLRQKFFKRNGGLLLQQQLLSLEGNIEKTKLFNSKELERATDNFNGNMILGQGGQGTVYKGMLVDGRIVAIKKSKVPDEGNVEQFINELSILSQINHRNVVKLLGCCLETEVPLLVYEFIPNGTLYQYLHDPIDEGPVPWDVRLRIASEVAGALFYLHYAASKPIYHRDIKTTNILLDERYRAKVADFGASKLVALDQTHVTTLVQGTFGYLDPEYFQSSQFTDKSDVYSFGVVLVELLTGQKPISSHRAEEGRSLATYFILSMEDGHLFDIVDAGVLNEGNKGEIIAVAHLAKRCLNPHGRMRPTMKEVAPELESIRRSWLPSNVQELQNKERYGSFEIDVTQTQDATFRLTGSEAGEGRSSDIFPLLTSNYTW